ncbi:hypothetical protein [Thermomonospora umbrina]|uniref:Uncharacterized protein n=1 Tax=Thermomonospora umbrina TaxID=111806 RepID=A0A3D9SXI5_9ACTN|nr:hypothetical protein [Thermomonospora umbrina]REE98763.1 hypothetical protein DFJ69_4259 [Thermomonospora umbrina]
MTLFNEMTAGESYRSVQEAAAVRSWQLEPQAAARVRVLRRARRDAEVRAIRVRRILLTR